MTTELVELLVRVDAALCTAGLADNHELRQGIARALASRAGVPDGWVSVKDRLPERAGIAGAVLAFDAARPGKGVWLETIHPSWWGAYNDALGEWVAEVTHWQPLPAAPEPLAVGSSNSTNDEESV